MRQALRTLVAQRGFHGASMSAIAAEAGVATGTAYTHYGSKDELVLATYLETKAQLGAAATAKLDPAERFRAIWLASYRHLAANPDHARFLLQVDTSPLQRPGARSGPGAGRRPDPPAGRRPGDGRQAPPPAARGPLRARPRPPVRLAANEAELSDAELEAAAAA